MIDHLSIFKDEYEHCKEAVRKTKILHMDLDLKVAELLFREISTNENLPTNVRKMAREWITQREISKTLSMEN